MRKDAHGVFVLFATAAFGFGENVFHGRQQRAGGLAKTIQGIGGLNRERTMFRLRDPAPQHGQGFGGGPDSRESLGDGDLNRAGRIVEA